MKTLVVAVHTTDRARVAEALRAAVGLTLRGDRVQVVRLAKDAPLDDELARRALATLAALGHDIDAPPAAIGEADAVEIWS